MSLHFKKSIEDFDDLKILLVTVPLKSLKLIIQLPTYFDNIGLPSGQISRKHAATR